MGESFGTWLEEHLNRKGWDQAELAIRSKVDPASISRILAGERQASVNVCIAFARALHISREEIFQARGWLIKRRVRGQSLTVLERLHVLVDLLSEKEAEALLILLLRGSE